MHAHVLLGIFQTTGVHCQITQMCKQRTVSETLLCQRIHNGQGQILQSLHWKSCLCVLVLCNLWWLQICCQILQMTDEAVRCICLISLTSEILVCVGMAEIAIYLHGSIWRERERDAGVCRHPHDSDRGIIVLLRRLTMYKCVVFF